MVRVRVTAGPGSEPELAAGPGSSRRGLSWMSRPGWPLQSDWCPSLSSKAFYPTSRRPVHRDWPSPRPPQSGRFPVHRSELEQDQEECEHVSWFKGHALNGRHLQLDDRFQRVCLMASSLTSVQKMIPSSYRKSTAAASTRSPTTTADSPRVPPPSTNRTSRRLANRSRGKPGGRQRFQAVWNQADQVVLWKRRQTTASQTRKHLARFSQTQTFKVSFSSAQRNRKSRKTTINHGKNHDKSLKIPINHRKP